jgi:hypothetical protein
MARSIGILVKSNNGGIRPKGMVMSVWNVVKKWDLVVRSTRIPLKSNNKWDKR